MASKNNIPNPFITSISIPEKLFCGRNEETRQILDLLENGNNVVLKSKRRIGKSALITHILAQREIQKKYNTFYVDIYGTKNADDFSLLFQQTLLAEKWMSKTKLKESFSTMLKGLRLSLGTYNSLTGEYSLPSIGLSPNEIPRIPLPELFEAMENSDKPCIAVFDEFQQIQYYPENFAATIRSYIQRLNNVHFIFSGSSKHMLAIMFNDYGQPFYKSARSVDLDALPLDTYTRFCKKIFAENKKEITEDAVRYVYELFSGETLLMQQTMNDVFSKTPAKGTADKQACTDSVISLLRTKDSDYKDILQRLDNIKERNTLFYIAYQGVAEKPTATETIRRFRLQGPAQVQNALKNLGEENRDLIERISRAQYVIKDRLFELWLAERMGILQYKLENASFRYSQQKDIESQLPALDIKSKK